jgi:PBSX family phage terminase large subunit
MMSGKTAESLYDNIIRLWESFDPENIVVTRQPLRVRIPSRGIEIACADAHNERSWGRIQGKTVFGWLADEVTQHPYNFVKMAQSRCRGEGKIWPKFWTCNPDQPEHYIKTEYVDNTELDVKSWHFTLDDNPVLTEEYKDELKSSYSGVFYDRYILGKWVLAEGMVYDEYDPGLHLFDKMELPEGWVRVRAIDYGYTNPFVCLWGAIDYDGRLYIYDEHYQPRMLIKEHADAVKARGGAYAWTVADHDAQDNAEMRNQGVQTKNAKKDVIEGIQKVKARMKVQGDGFPRLFISRACRNLVKELGLYSWASPKMGRSELEEPVKANDHAMDALRYMVMEIDKGSGRVSAVPMGAIGL